jgi:hypothetical protein
MHKRSPARRTGCAEASIANEKPGPMSAMGIGGLRNIRHKLNIVYAYGSNNPSA